MGQDLDNDKKERVGVTLILMIHAELKKKMNIYEFVELFIRCA